MYVLHTYSCSISVHYLATPPSLEYICAVRQEQQRAVPSNPGALLRQSCQPDSSTPTDLMCCFTCPLASILNIYINNTFTTICRI